LNYVSEFCMANLNLQP